MLFSFMYILTLLGLHIIQLYVFSSESSLQSNFLYSGRRFCEIYILLSGSCCLCFFFFLQIHPLSLWFQMSSSWPDSLTTWLSLRTDPFSLPPPHPLFPSSQLNCVIQRSYVLPVFESDMQDSSRC